MLTKLRPVTLLLLRLFTAFMFWQHGAEKLFGWFLGKPAAPFSVTWFAGGVEFLGAIAIAIGFFTRPVAAVLAIDMAILYITQYLPNGAFPPILVIDAEVACMLFLIAALFVFSGPETLSVDAALKKNQTPNPLESYYPEVLGIFRILIGVFFIQHGLQKWFGMLGAEEQPMFALRWYAGIIEFFGGIAIVFGFLTRPVAFILCGEMAFAYFINHNIRGFWPIRNAGERAVLFCYVYLFVLTAGPGKFSLDSVLWKTTGHPQQPVPSRN